MFLKCIPQTKKNSSKYNSYPHFRFVLRILYIYGWTTLFTNTCSLWYWIRVISILRCSMRNTCLGNSLPVFTRYICFLFLCRDTNIIEFEAFDYGSQRQTAVCHLHMVLYLNINKTRRMSIPLHRYVTRAWSIAEHIWMNIYVINTHAERISMLS